MRSDISDKMRVVFKNLFLGKEINYKLLQDLDDTEKTLIKSFINKSGLKADLDFNYKYMEYSKKDIMDLFESQKGLIIALWYDASNNNINR